MPRKPRIHYPGAFYHIIARGNNQQLIFFSDRDRCKFLSLLQEMSERFCCRIHGFCLMSNHVHLIVQVSENHISDAMQNLLFRYTRYFNQRTKRIGHLFQGRFKSILVKEGGYLLELIRYIHLNPVRGGIVAKPEDYSWSSHRTFLGKETLIWLTVDWILNKFDAHGNTARQRYERFVNRQTFFDIDFEKFKQNSHEEKLSNSDEFVETLIDEDQFNSKVSRQYSEKFSLVELIELICEELDESLSVLKLPGKEREGVKLRSLVAYFVKKTPHLTLKELADVVGRDVSSLSKHASNLEVKSNNDKRVSFTLKKLTEEINKRWH